MNTVSRWIRSVAILTIVTAGVFPALHAQNDFGRARINVPFAFDYGSRHFAPGVYMLDLSSPHFLMVRAANGSMAATAMVQNEITAQAPVRSKAVFLKSGSSYRLQSLWIMGSNDYYDIIPFKTKRQPELASNRAPSSAWK